MWRTLSAIVPNEELTDLGPFRRGWHSSKPIDKVYVIALSLYSLHFPLALYLALLFAGTYFSSASSQVDQHRARRTGASSGLRPLSPPHTGGRTGPPHRPSYPQSPSTDPNPPCSFAYGCSASPPVSPTPGSCPHHTPLPCGPPPADASSGLAGPPLGHGTGTGPLALPLWQRHWPLIPRDPYMSLYPPIPKPPPTIDNPPDKNSKRLIDSNLEILPIWIKCLCHLKLEQALHKALYCILGSGLDKW